MTASKINIPKPIHLRHPEDSTKTWCGCVIWEAVQVTENTGQVTCPECLKENCGQRAGTQATWDSSMAAQLSMT